MVIHEIGSDARAILGLVIPGKLERAMARGPAASLRSVAEERLADGGPGLYSGSQKCLFTIPGGAAH